MNKVSPWLTLLPLLFGYAILVFVAMSLSQLIDGYAGLYIYAVFYPVLMLSGAWAVLGTGSYAVRTICSIAAVLTIVLAGALGLAIIFPRKFVTHDLPLSSVEIFVIIACIGIPLICATQIPYWLGRLIFGWQLIDEAKPPEQKKLDIKDMLTVTAVLAVCLVAPTRATSMVYQAFHNPIEIGDHEFGHVTDPTTGETTWKTTTVSAENIDQFRREHATEAAQAQQFGLIAVSGYMLLVALSSLINVPCF